MCFCSAQRQKMLVWCVIRSFECNSPCQAVSVLILDLLSLNTLGPPGAVCPCVPWEHLLRRTMNKTHYASNMLVSYLKYPPTHKKWSETYSCIIYLTDYALSVFFLSDYLTQFLKTFVTFDIIAGQSNKSLSDILTDRQK